MRLLLLKIVTIIKKTTGYEKNIKNYYDFIENMKNNSKLKDR